VKTISKKKLRYITLRLQCQFGKRNNRIQLTATPFQIQEVKREGGGIYLPRRVGNLHVANRQEAAAVCKK
jgi:hypothetical protein